MRFGRKRSTWYASAAVLLLTLATVSVLRAHPAQANFATECAAPDRTIAGGSADLTMAPGEVVLITGPPPFTGGVNAWPADATVCVAPGATFTPSLLAEAHGRFLNEGVAALPPVVTGPGASIENGGTLTLESVNNNAALTVLNLPTGIIIVQFPLTLANGAQVVNQGTVTTFGEVNLNPGTDIINFGTIDIGGNLNVNGDLLNSGVATVAGAVNVNSGATLTNLCRFNSNTVVNDNLLRNEGILDVDGGSFINNADAAQTATGLTVGTTFANPGDLTGSGGYTFTGDTVTTGSMVGEAGDPIAFFDASQTDSQILDTENGIITNVVRVPVPVPPPDFLPPGCTNINATVTATPPSSTTASPSATTASPPTGTMSPTASEPPTQTQPPTVTTTPVAPPLVGLTGGGASGAATALPSTGRPIGGLIPAGTLLIAAGLVLLALRERRAGR